jgi:hypothetical protein
VGGGHKINTHTNTVALTSLSICNVALSLDSIIGVVTRLEVGI